MKAFAIVSIVVSVIVVICDIYGVIKKRQRKLAFLAMFFGDVDLLFNYGSEVRNANYNSRS